MYIRHTPLAGKDRFELTLSDESATFKIEKQEEGSDPLSLLEQLLEKHPSDKEKLLAAFKSSYQPIKWKLWGPTTRVLYFDSVEDIFLHYKELFFKKIEIFEGNEFICTDSKGRYVSTIREAKGEWEVMKDGIASEKTAREDKSYGKFPNLNEAFTFILNSTDV